MTSYCRYGNNSLFVFYSYYEFKSTFWQLGGHFILSVEGTKEILGYSIAPNESAEIWKELLEDFKSRGLESVSLFCTDSLAGMEEVIEQTFPAAKIQRCLVHISRNIAAKVRVTDRKEILDDFKEVYNASKL